MTSILCVHVGTNHQESRVPINLRMHYTSRNLGSTKDKVDKAELKSVKPERMNAIT